MKVKEGMKTVYALNAQGQQKLHQYVAECAFIEAVLLLEQQADKGDMPHIKAGGEIIVFDASDFDPVEVLA